MKCVLGKKGWRERGVTGICFRISVTLHFITVIVQKKY